MVTRKSKWRKEMSSAATADASTSTRITATNRQQRGDEAEVLLSETSSSAGDDIVAMSSSNRRASRISYTCESLLLEDTGTSAVTTQQQQQHQQQRQQSRQRSDNRLSDSSGDVFLPLSRNASPHQQHQYVMTPIRVTSSAGATTATIVARRLSRASSSSSHVTRATSLSDIVSALPLRSSHAEEAALHAQPLVLSSNQGGGKRVTRQQSIGKEWTRLHWDKMKDLEQEASRARRCSKLSSGFAPLMIFGGLVFVCIGVSASMNTGKDQARLKQLSHAPLSMGSFMLVLGAALIATWFGCRARARALDQKVIHGSTRSLARHVKDSKLLDAILAKLYGGQTNEALHSGDETSDRFPEVFVESSSVVCEGKAMRLATQRCDRCGTSSNSPHVAVRETQV